MRKLFKKYREYRLRKWVAKMVLSTSHCDFDNARYAEQMYKWIKGAL